MNTRAAVLAALLATTATACAAATYENTDVAGLEAAMKAGDVTLIDVRTAGEYAGGHVEGAINIPVNELVSRMGELPAKGSTIHVICQSGGRSASASGTLEGAGYKAVNITGGTGAWISSGRAVVK